LFWAINKKLYEDCKKEGKTEIESIKKSLCLSIQMLSINKELFDQNTVLVPGYTEFYGYDRIERKVFTEQKWTYVKGFDRKVNDQEQYVRSYFTPSEKGTEYTIRIEDKDLMTHKSAQDVLLVELLEGSLEVEYNGIMIPLTKFNIKKFSDFQDYLEVEIEIQKGGHKSSRRADLLVKFKDWNDKFGKGIAFEIFNTESEKSIKEKEYDWNLSHYSYVSLNINQFDLINSHIKKNRQIKLNAAMDFFKGKQMEDLTKLRIKMEKQAIQNFKMINENEQYIGEQLTMLKDQINDILMSADMRTKDRLDEINTKVNKLNVITSHKQGMVDELEKKKEEIVNVALQSLNSNISSQTEKIIQKIQQLIKEKVDWGMIQKVEDLNNNFTDLMNRLDKQIFNSCEQNRTFCLNIIKKKIDDYFQEKINEMKKNG